jgi:hypothetical protein
MREIYLEVGTLCFELRDIAYTISSTGKEADMLDEMATAMDSKKYHAAALKCRELARELRDMK